MVWLQSQAAVKVFKIWIRTKQAPIQIIHSNLYNRINVCINILLLKEAGVVSM
jgi:hypothetical protein